jgi:5-aminolevulinate synthase
MGHALAQRGFSASATCPVSHHSSSSANPSIGESSLLNKTKATAAGPSPATVQRGYASIAAVEAAALERATSPSSPQPSFVNPASIAPSAGLDGEGVRTAADQGHAQGRPTCALGFAKHVVTSHRPGFDFEAFYEAELDKKHKDKSYRVRCASPSFVRRRNVKRI